MSYITTISIPVVFDARSDAEARIRLREILMAFAQSNVLPGIEISDAPTAEALEEFAPYEPLRRVPADDLDAGQTPDVFVTADGYRLEHAWGQAGNRLWTDGDLIFQEDEHGWPVDDTDLSRLDGYFLDGPSPY